MSQWNESFCLRKHYSSHHSRVTLELPVLKHFSPDLQQFMLPTGGLSPLIITVISAIIVIFTFQIYSLCGTWA